MVASEKVYGYSGAVIYIIILFLLLFLLRMNFQKPIEIPAGGVDVDLGVTETGFGDENPVDPSANASTAEVSETDQELTNDAEETDVVSTTEKPKNPTKTNTTNQNTNNNNNTSSEADDLWSQASSNSGSQGNTKGKGNQGDPNGTEGGTGKVPCKGCTGGGSLGNGDATSLVRPDINNQDEGTIVVRVKIDKNGTVVDVKEYGNKGTIGNISEDSYRRARQAAFKTRFAADPTAGELRTGYITYNLRRN
jgi:hypothetical protein